MDKSNETNELVVSRLKKQRAMWRKDHPYGFVAKPIVNADESVNMLKWKCIIPGPKDTVWQGGQFKMTIDFTRGYPARPPLCKFYPVPPHPNIYPSGNVCLSILNQEEDWRPHYPLKQILLGIQKLLADEPNIQSPAQLQALTNYKNQKEKYIENAKKFAIQSKRLQLSETSIKSVK